MRTTSSPLVDAVSATRVDHAMTEQLYRSAGMTLCSSFAAASLLTYVFWVSAAPPGLFVWYVVNVSWTILRYGVVRVVLARGISVGQSRRLDWLFALVSGVAGVIWGYAVVFVAYLGPETELLVVPCVMAALSVSAIVGYSRSLPTFAAFLIPCVLPFSVELVWLGGSLEPMMAGFVLFWGVLLGVIARHLNRGFRSRIELSIRNTELIQRLTTARDLAESANLSKTRFLANMSHELRTPLNAIMGYSEMMALRTLGPQAFGRYDGYPEIVLGSGQHLLGIVDQILDVSKLEAGAVDLSNDLIYVPDLIDNSVKFMSPAAEQDGVLLSTDYPDQMPCLRGDATKVRQIILNLLSNAVKFTPQGGSVSVRVSPSLSGEIEISVADTGIGIPSEDMEQVLTPFARMENQEYLASVKILKSGSGRTHTGLGLPLVKLLSDLHGARFELTSTVDVGTVARVTFPASRAVFGENVTELRAAS